MKRFKDYIKEQHMAKGETTLDPDFTEKKEKRDRQIEKKIMEPTKEVNQEAKRTEKSELPTQE